MGVESADLGDNVGCLDWGRGEERKGGKGGGRVIDLEADVETADLILHVAKDDLVRLKVAEDGQKSLLSPVGRGDKDSTSKNQSQQTRIL